MKRWLGWFAAASLPAAVVLPAVTSPSHTEITLVEQRDAAAPRLRLVVAVFSGSAEDPAGREGAAAVAARALAPESPAISVSVDKDATQFSCDAGPEDFEPACGALIDALGRPAPAADRIEAARRAGLEALDALRASGSLLEEAFDALAFRGGPRAHPAPGTTAGLSALTAEDLAAFLAAHYRKGNVVAGLSGPTSAAVLTRVRDGLAALPDGPPTRARKPLSYLARPRALIVEQAGARPRAEAGVPLPVRRAHPDYMALWIASGPGDRHDALRDRSAFVTDLQLAPATGAGLQSAGAALQSGLRDLAGRLRQGPDDARIEQSMNALLAGRTPAESGAEAAMIDQILDLQWGTPGFQTRLPESLRALAPQVVRDALRRHVPPERLAVAVIVPDAARFLEEAAAAGGFLSKDDFEVAKAGDLFR